MWTVSQFLLQEGVQRSLLEAIKQNLELKNREDISGIRDGILVTQANNRSF